MCCLVSGAVADAAVDGADRTDCADDTDAVAAVVDVVFFPGAVAIMRPLLCYWC